MQEHFMKVRARVYLPMHWKKMSRKSQKRMEFICCGPYANGITSTGVTATTNHTIAVDPSVIPYGSKVVINGQVYVAEDCGGAIKNKRIDIYVATHAEGEAKGTYDTEVYLLK